MPRLLDDAEVDAELPTRTDVVVIGGGIIGVTTALSLAERGVAVTLVEKGRIAGEQSSRNWGWCRTMGRDLAEVPLAIESLRLWDRMATRIGADVGFRRAGVVYVCETQRELDAQAGWLEQARAYQVATRLLDAAETAALLPGAARRWPGALHTPNDGRAEPQHAVPAMVAAARRHGAVVLENCAARGLDLTAGRVSGVVTEQGRIRCGSVVLAGGAWSRLFCGNAGVVFPQLRILGSVFRTAPLDGPDITTGGRDFAFRKRQDGGYTVARRNASRASITPDSVRLLPKFGRAFVKQRHELRLRFDPARFSEEWRTPRRWSLDAPTPFEAVRVLDPAADEATVEDGRRALVRAFPAFRAMRIAGSWGGMIDVTPDGVPVISAVDSLPGFHLASGFSGHGFGIGPGAGRLMADLVAGDRPLVDPAPFRLARLH